MNPAGPAAPRRAATTCGAARPLSLLLTVLLTVLLSLAGALGLAAGTAAPAHAVPPLTDLEDEITDPAGVLGDDAPEVQEALDRLADETPYQLFVVYVDSFDGIDGRDWANATATNAALGVNDLLLAVATGDEAYGLSVDTSIGLSDERLDAIETATEDELRDGSWAGAAVAAADAVLGDDSGSAGGGSSWGVVLAVLVVVLLAVVGWFWFRARRRARATTTIGRHGTPVPGEDTLAALSTDELERRAGAALVEVDDAVRTSDQELGFAQAEFGVETTREFAAALETARGDLTGAFRRQQELDDETPDDEPQRRGILLDILARCARAAAALDAQADAFDELRDLHARAPELLTETAQRAEEVGARVDVARRTLDGLTSTYPASALTSVRENPDQAEALVANARDAVATGQEALSERTRNTAVGHLRAAQNALGQAVTLLDAVEKAGTALATAGADLDKGIASISQDVSDADRLAPGDPAVEPAVTEARAAVDQARDARSGGDPLAALRRITAAEAALDAALVGARQQAETDARANALLRDVLARVDAQVTATQDYVATRRGAVGPQARTRLAEAARLADEARALQRTDPSAALDAAHRAESRAQDAARLARQDTDTWGMNQGGSGSGSGSAGMVLGGILLGEVLRGSGGRGSRRGYGGRSGGFGGGFGGGFRGGGRSRRGGGRSGGNRGGRGGRSRGGRF